MPEKDVVLENRDRYNPFEATMYHSVVCRNGCRCGMEEVTGRGGAPSLTPVRKERSFWIPPASFSEPLPREVLDIPQVKVARAKGTLRVAGEDLIQVNVIPGA